MSFEYFIEIYIEEIDQVSDAIMKGLKNNGRYEVLDFSNSVITLRYCNDIKRSEWEEDIEIIFQENRILIVIHSGTRNERDYLLEFIEKILKSLSINSLFEEV